MLVLFQEFQWDVAGAVAQGFFHAAGGRSDQLRQISDVNRTRAARQFIGDCLQVRSTSISMESPSSSSSIAASVGVGAAVGTAVGGASVGTEVAASPQASSPSEKQCSKRKSSLATSIIPITVLLEPISHQCG